MTADGYITSREKTVSGALALAMHALFFALLVFGVSWQKRYEPPVVMVDLWRELPPLPEPLKEAPPPALPKPAAKAEPKPAPKPEPAVKPDIALKEKLEKEREARERAAAEKKRKEEQALAERKRREEQALAEKKRQEEQAQLAALRAQEAEVERRAREQEEALRKLAAQQAAARQTLISEYEIRIRNHIRRFIVEPPNLQGNPETEFDVVLLPGGEVLGVKTRKPSGVVAWDNAVERAILRAQPLPLPPDPALFREFRELHLKFRPKE